MSLEADVAVSVMSRIERSAQQTYSPYTGGGKLGNEVSLGGSYQIGRTSRSALSRTTNDIFVACQLLRTDRTAGV